MKLTKALIAALCLACTAMAEQKIIVVPCDDGKPKLTQLEEALKQGWRVISAVPVHVTKADNFLIGKTWQPYTANIVYVVEK